MTNFSNQQMEWEYWYPRVYGYFYKRVNNKTDVEDLTSNTLSTVFTANNVLNFQAYTWKVAHNYLVRFIDLKTKTPTPIPLDENLNWSPSQCDLESENAYCENYTAKLSNLRLCIESQLSEESDKQLIDLSIYQEKNSTEIGQIMNLKPDTVRQKLSRTIKKLKKNCSSLWHSN
jgi:RNA polymerase sigma factor (sigma-70 family)